MTQRKRQLQQRALSLGLDPEKLKRHDDAELGEILQIMGDFYVFGDLEIIKANPNKKQNKSKELRVYNECYEDDGKIFNITSHFLHCNRNGSLKRNHFDHDKRTYSLLAVETIVDVINGFKNQCNSKEEFESKYREINKMLMRKNKKCEPKPLLFLGEHCVNCEWIQHHVYNMKNPSINEVSDFLDKYFYKETLAVLTYSEYELLKSRGLPKDWDGEDRFYRLNKIPDFKVTSPNQFYQIKKSLMW